MRVTLTTDRLILRPLSPDDAEAMFCGWASDPEVTKYLTWNPHADVDETRARLEKWDEEYQKPERLNFGIVEKETGVLIGNINVVGYIGGPSGTPVIGYCLSRAAWGKGYMTEACRCLIAYLFERGHTCVRIDAVRENLASNRVIVKCGGRQIGADEEFVEAKGRFVTVNRYIIVPSSERDRPGASAGDRNEE